VKYRDAQLENYTPDIEYSASDYHHTRPLNLTKTYSTCQFPKNKSKGHGRQASKFTVISNAADTEHSYDPFNASRAQHLNRLRDDHVTVTIHRGEDKIQVSDTSTIHRQGSRASCTTENRRRQQSLAPPRFYTSRSSMASSTRSRISSHHARAGLTYKRGVSFSGIRRVSQGSQPKRLHDLTTPTRSRRRSNKTEVTDDDDSMLPELDSTQYLRSKKPQTEAHRPLPSAKPGRASLIWGEDVRQLSSSLAKDCDEAFNRSSVVSNAGALEDHVSKTKARSLSRCSNSAQPSSQFVATQSRLHAPKAKFDRSSINNRPLPRAPVRTESVELELIEARKRAELRKQRSGDGDSPRYLDRMVSHIDQLIQPVSPDFDRRVNSAPIDPRRVSLARPLPSIYEARCEESSPRRGQISSISEHQGRVETKGGRTASAPEPRDTSRPRPDDQPTRRNSVVRDSIRIVTSTSTESPVKAPAPLFIRKKSSQTQQPAMSFGVGFDRSNQSNWRRASGVNLREQFQAGTEFTRDEDLERTEEGENDEHNFDDENSTGTIVKKRSGWFRRSSKSKREDFQLSVAEQRLTSKNAALSPPYERPANPHLNTPPKHEPRREGFSFGRLFRRYRAKPGMAVIGKFYY
jgi:serine/threonine-protein kinase HSL1 (negative regulator of Swe1 kinase)